MEETESSTAQGKSAGDTFSEELFEGIPKSAAVESLFEGETQPPLRIAYFATFAMKKRPFSILLEIHNFGNLRLLRCRQRRALRDFRNEWDGLVKVDLETDGNLLSGAPSRSRYVNK
jgi:hypothetical protein